MAHLSRGRELAQVQAVQPPRQTRDLDLLSALERRIGRAPQHVLQVPPDASIAEICEAFALLVHACEPLQFANDAAKVARARRAVRHLRLAFRAAIGRELAPRHPPHVPSRAGLVT